MAYQEQITGLPRGYDVALNGVRYDGCDDLTGNMLEAKGPNLVWMFLRPGNWVFKADFYVKSMRQAATQSLAAGNRLVEWHFADKLIADFFKIQFHMAGLNNIIVKHTPAKILKFLSDYLYRNAIGAVSS